jgi:uncharacterized membrane protein
MGMAEHLAAIAEAHGAKKVSDEADALGYAVGLLTWALAGGVFVAAKAAVDELPPWTLVFWRLVVAMLALLPFVSHHFPDMRAMLRKRGFEILAIGAIGLGITQGLMFTGLTYTSAVNAGIIFATTPIFTLVLARVVLREDMSCGAARLRLRVRRSSRAPRRGRLRRLHGFSPAREIRA